MNKRNFIKRAFLSTGLLTIPFLGFSGNKFKGKFVHTVLFWLNDGTDTKDFVDGTKQFIDQVEVVRSYHVGTPAMTPREVVDNSYSVCLVVTFDSKEDQDIYQKHPAHLAYVEQRKDQWNNVLIYDSLKYES